jgi:cobalt/nickel transport system permease protein
VSFHHLDQYAAVPSPLTRLPAVTRLLGAVTLALGAAALPHGAWTQLGALGLMVLVLALLGHVPLGIMIRRMVWPLGFVVLASVLLLVFVPGTPLVRLGPVSLTDTGVARFGGVLARASVALGAAVLLVSTTGFSELLHALRQVRLPRAVTVSLGLAYRLLYILVDEIERLQRAALSRNAGAGAASRRRLLAGVGAAALGRSLARGERTYRAMLARGYQGDMRPLHDPPVTTAGVVASAGLAALVAAVVAWSHLETP